MKQYTNEFTAQIQASFNEPTFTPEQIASMTESARAIIAEQRETNRLHPVIGIYRFATVGSLTRRGGIVHETNHEAKMQAENGEMMSIALKGDEVVYPDGTTARIATSTGKSKTCKGRGIALVGSKLDNGDEIISTPQSGVMCPVRRGIPFPEDFLADEATA
ncbi:PAAR domain-containing protein [Raoultella sp. T31]|uniref:PAAR domain-containing protein n=1 Tax=Raoultella sp. T31 TaxID=2054594 RepID=UPI000C287485|nr:hypothetical protein CWM52_09930 [Raoultella sp. T31]